MARRYDQSTTTFSPEGRLHQVEYAIEAINNAGTCVGIQSSEGVVLAAEKRVISKLLAPSKQSEKTFVIDKHIATLIAGFTSDASILIDHSRLLSQRYLFQYKTPIPVEQVVRGICDYKHSYTQYGGLRPFGVGFLIAGWDEQNGFQLYQSDPSGNYGGWKATVIGQNNQPGKSILKTDFVENNTISNNINLAIKVLLKTMDSTTPSAERIEISYLSRNSNGDVELAFVPEAEVETLIQRMQAEAEAEQQKEAAVSGDI